LFAAAGSIAVLAVLFKRWRGIFQEFFLINMIGRKIAAFPR
jgi:hypothetical protein